MKIAEPALIAPIEQKRGSDWSCFLSLFLHYLRNHQSESVNPTTILKAHLPKIRTAIPKTANELLPPYRELDAVPWDEMEVSLAKHGLTPELAEACVALFITIKVLNPSAALWLREIEKVAA